MVPYNLASDCCWRLVIKQSAFGKLIVKLVGVDKQPGSGFVFDYLQDPDPAADFKLDPNPFVTVPVRV